MDMPESTRNVERESAFFRGVMSYMEKRSSAPSSQNGAGVAEDNGSRNLGRDITD